MADEEKPARGEVGQVHLKSVNNLGEADRKKSFDTSGCCS
jgi:hypothetical protein